MVIDAVLLLFNAVNLRTEGIDARVCSSSRLFVLNSTALYGKPVFEVTFGVEIFVLNDHDAPLL